MVNLKKKRVLSGQDNKQIVKHYNVGKGKILAMFANGPSILKAPIEKLMDLENVDTMTLKRPDDRCFPTTAWVMPDIRDINRMAPWLRTYEGKLFTSNHKIERLPGSKSKVFIKGQTRLSIKPGTGFTKDILGPIFSGYSSAYIGLQVAFYMGYESIYIFGLDMCDVDGEAYSYPKEENTQYPGQESREKMFSLEANAFLFAFDNVLDEDDKGKIILCTENNPHEFAKELVTCTPEAGVDHLMNVKTEEEEEDDPNDESSESDVPDSLID